MSKARLLSRVVRLPVIVTALVSAYLVGSPDAHATITDPPGSGCSWNCVANEVVFLDPTTNGTEYYFDVKAHQMWARHYDFGFDGCSVPSWVYKALEPFHLDDDVATYAKFFRPSCRIHDFGYRNFGKGPYTVKAGDSPDARKSVDDRFHALMDRKCAHNPPKILPIGNTAICRTVADVFYEAVRKFGAGAW